MGVLASEPALAASCCLVVTGIFLVVVLVPLTFSYVEYYEYGLVQRKTTGSVDTSQVYGRGRYNLGPDYRFLKYQADAHHKHIDDLGVFSAGGSNESIGLTFELDVDFTFLLKRDEVGALHRELASSYETVIVSRAKDAIKNEAIFVTFDEFFQARKAVERRFRDAVQRRWDALPPLHCTLDQFHLGRIQIPESVGERQLESRIQNERNDREAFIQQAQVEREQTAVAVNSINLERNKVLRTANAAAGLLRAKATAEAKQLMADAQNNGTGMLFEAANITSQDHMIAFSYIRTLMNHRNVNLDVNYLTPENILKTRSV